MFEVGFHVITGYFNTSICNVTISLFIKLVLEGGKLRFLLLSRQPARSNLIWPRHDNAAQVA